MFFAIGWGLSWELRNIVGEERASYVGFLISGVVCGAIVGGGAWVVVSHWTRSFVSWVLLNIAGFMFGGVAGLSIAMAREGDTTSALIGGAIIGLIFGAAQWLALRKVPRAGWWPLVNALAIAAAFWSTVSLGGEGREFIAVGAASLVYALITGAAVAWIFGGLTEAC